MDSVDSAWYGRCREEVQRLKNLNYDRSGAHYILRSLMTEGFLWLYEAQQR